MFTKHVLMLINKTLKTYIKNKYNKNTMSVISIIFYIEIFFGFH